MRRLPQFALALALIVAAGCGGDAEPPRPLDLEDPIFVRHETVVTGEGGDSIPTYVVAPGAASAVIEMCVRSRASGSEHWSMEFTIETLDGWYYTAVPSSRSSDSICFARSIPLDRVRRLSLGARAIQPFKLCARGVNELRRGRDLGCHPVHVVEDAGYRERESIINELWRDSVDPDFLGDVQRSLLDLTDHPLQRIRAAAVAAATLTNAGEPGHLEAAGQLLDNLIEGSDLDSPAYREVSGLVYREVGQLRTRAGEHEEAWAALVRAEADFAATGSRHRIAVTDLQAQIIADEGAVRYGIDYLGRSLDECRESLFHCDRRYIDTVEANYAWLITSDPLASASELVSAGRIFRDAVAAEQNTEGERVNQLINIAHVAQIRSERSEGGALADAPPVEAPLPGLIEEARSALAAAQPSDSAFLAGWIDLIAARDRLARERRVPLPLPGEVRVALETCESIVERQRGSANGLAALAALCAGRAAALDPERGWVEAARNFTEARALFQTSTTADLAVPMGPSHESDAYYWSAVALLHGGAAEAAWNVLTELDREVASGCPDGSEDRALRFRAFWVDDHVWLMERTSGRVRYEALTLDRSRLIRAQDALAETTDGPTSRAPDGPAWDAPLGGLAQRLLEWTEAAPDEPIEIALYGALQPFPIDAIRLTQDSARPGETSAAESYLGRHRLIALRPACAVARRGETTGAGRAGLFALNPLGDLRGSDALAALLEELFPEPGRRRTLRGDEMTRDALADAILEAQFLHVDTHGMYDPVFPKRSALLLAEEEKLTIEELAEIVPPLEFANLSACQTGRSPVSAGSGQFGFGGAFARLGTRWIIATTSRIEDDIASEFNESFYRALAGGATVPAAYWTSISTLRDRYAENPEKWLMLRLLAAGQDRFPT